MSRTIDVRNEMRKLADRKPVHAAAGAGALATDTLRELPGRFARWRAEASVGTLSARASEVVQTARARAVTEYDKLARRGKQALNGEATHGRGALNGKSSRAREAKD
ncbi:MAG TPA: hypothetical protein VG123_27100 [Streptosporangiaceae bacterium]|jgi:hypothetical protein|nr:hypothetical protein [Streptosporangiaceae bacterium]